MNNIYLDHASSTFLRQSTIDYLISILPVYGNPSSVHSVGESVKQIILNARKSVAKFINANPECIYFTPSGSASNTLAIRGYYLKHNCTLLYSPISHKSILKCVDELKYAYPLKVDKNGFIDIYDLKEWLDTRKKIIVVMDYANSEIGTVQNVKKIIDLVHFYNGIIYLDCTGSIPTIPVDIEELEADIVGFSAHKLGGLKGCGVLYKKSDIELEPLIYGNQEDGMIGGTENILGIASLGKAIECYDYSSISPNNRNYIYERIINNIPNSYLVGASIESGCRLPHNLYICFKGVDSESLMVLLDMNGIQVSTGSACNSKNITSSSTLQAIGMNKEDINSCIRMSFCGCETKDELDYICEKLQQCIETLRNMITK